jgi:hypothetical protein
MDLWNGIPKFNLKLLTKVKFSDFAKGYWGQALRNNDVTKNLKLMIYDDVRKEDMNEFADAVKILILKEHY